MDTLIIILSFGLMIFLTVIAVKMTIKKKQNTLLILGKKISSFTTAILGKVSIVSNNSMPLVNNWTTACHLYEKGLKLSQGGNEIKISWNNIINVGFSNFEQAESYKTMGIEGALIGHALGGQTGAIIGGINSSREQIRYTNDHVFNISFYDEIFGVSSMSLMSKTSIVDFAEKYIELNKNRPQTFYELGAYKAMQIINEEQITTEYTIMYNKAVELISINVDKRNANFNIHFTKNKSSDFLNLFIKALEWKEKALEAKLNTDKEVGTLDTDLSFSLDDQLYFVSGNVTIGFKCWFDKYDTEANAEIDDYYVIAIYTSSISAQINTESLKIEKSVLFTTGKEAEKFIDIIATENITNVIIESEKHSETANDILV